MTDSGASSLLLAGALPVQPAPQGIHLSHAWLRVCGGACEGRVRQGDVAQQGTGTLPAALRPARLRHHLVPGCVPPSAVPPAPIAKAGGSA